MGSSNTPRAAEWIVTAAEESAAIPLATQKIDLTKDSILGHRFMLRFGEHTLKHRPLGIRLIVEFIGTFILVTVAAGSGVINHHVGGDPISRTAAVIAPGAVVMAMICPRAAALGFPPPNTRQGVDAGSLSQAAYEGEWVAVPGAYAPEFSILSSPQRGSKIYAESGIDPAGSMPKPRRHPRKPNPRLSRAGLDSTTKPFRAAGSP